VEPRPVRSPRRAVDRHRHRIVTVPSLAIAGLWGIGFGVSPEGIEAFLGDPITRAFGIPLILAFLGGSARLFARRGGGPRWSDAYVGIDLTLAALSGAIVAVTQRSEVAPAEASDVMGPYLALTFAIFVGVVVLHRMCEHWDHHPVWRALLLNGLANALGFFILLGFVVIVEF
jgi:hypothetical protein